MLALVEQHEVIHNDIASQFESFGVLQESEHEKTRRILIDRDDKRIKRQVQLSILESLRFQTMSHRHDKIADAHKTTFEWIFKDLAVVHFQRMAQVWERCILGPRQGWFRKIDSDEIYCGSFYDPRLP
jgi:hypothetical protein